MKTINLIYIGDRFYHESSTMMSSVYTQEGQRSDWSHIQTALRGGESITIRPATPEEIAHYEKELSRWQLKDNPE